MSESQNTVCFYVPVVDVGWSQNSERLLGEGAFVSLGHYCKAPPHSHNSIPESCDQPTSTTGKYKTYCIHSYPTQRNSNVTQYILYISYDTTYIHVDMNVLSISAPNSHLSCIPVVSPDDGQVMP
jgi:hypothetical protein